MSVPCTALPQSYVPPTQDDLFAKMQPVFELDPFGKQGQGAIPLTGEELIRRKAIESLSSEQLQALAREQRALALHHAQLGYSWQEVIRPLHLAPPQAPVRDMINHQVEMVERYLVIAVISSLSYQDRITLMYHYSNESNLLEAARFRSRLFKRVKELCTDSPWVQVMKAGFAGACRKCLAGNGTLRNAHLRLQ